MWKITSTSLSRYETKLDPEGIQGYQRVSESAGSPSWGEVKKFIERLDGDNCDTMSLRGPNGYGMTIGGGPDRFYVSTIGNDMGPYDLQGPDLSDETTKINFGGVTNEMERRFISLLPEVLQAAEYFYHHGKIDPGLNWHAC